MQSRAVGAKSSPIELVTLVDHLFTQTILRCDTEAGYDLPDQHRGSEGEIVGIDRPRAGWRENRRCSGWQAAYSSGSGEPASKTKARGMAGLGGVHSDGGLSRADGAG